MKLKHNGMHFKRRMWLDIIAIAPNPKNGIFLAYQYYSVNRGKLTKLVKSTSDNEEMNKLIKRSYLTPKKKYPVFYD